MLGGAIVRYFVRVLVESKSNMTSSLSTKWEAVKSVESFYTGGSLIWNEATSRLFSLCNEQIHVKNPHDPSSSTIVFGDEEDGIMTFTVSKNGKSVLSCHRSLLIKHWEPETIVQSSSAGTTKTLTWKCKNKWKGHSGFMTSASIDASNTLLATSSVDGSIKVWDISKGHCTHNFTSHLNVVQKVAFHPQKLVLYSSSDDLTLRAFDLNTNEEIFAITENVARITHFELTQQSSLSAPDHLIISTADKLLHILDATSGASLFQFPLPTDIETFLCIDRDTYSSYLLSQSNKKRARDGKKELGELRLDPEIERVGKKIPYVILSGGLDKVLSVWDPVELRLRALDDLVPSVTFNSPHAVQGSVIALFRFSGRHFASVGVDLTLAIWQTPSFTVTREMIGHASEFFSSRISAYPSSVNKGDEEKGEMPFEEAIKEKVCTTLTSDEAVRLIDLETLDVVSMKGNESTALCVSVSNDGRWMVVGGKDGWMSVYSTISFTCVARVGVHADAVSSVGLLRKDKSFPPISSDISFYSASGDKTIKMWKVSVSSFLETLNEIEQQRQELNEGEMREIGKKMKRNEREIAEVEDWGKTSTLRKHFNLAKDVLSKKKLQQLQVNKAQYTIVPSAKEVNCVKVAPNDKMFATGGQDKVIKIWNTLDGKLLKELKGHTKGVWDVAFSPTDRVLASCSGDKTIKIWNLGDYSLLRTLQAHEFTITQISFLPNGQQLMSASTEGVMKLWLNKSSLVMDSMDNHEGKVWDLCIEGGIATSAGADGKLLLWKDATQTHEQEKIEKRQREIEHDNEIHLSMKTGDYFKAFRSALYLNRPVACREVLEMLFDKPLSDILQQRDLRHMDTITPRPEGMAPMHVFQGNVASAVVVDEAGAEEEEDAFMQDDGIEKQEDDESTVEQEAEESNSEDKEGSAMVDDIVEQEDAEKAQEADVNTQDNNEAEEQEEEILNEETSRKKICDYIKTLNSELLTRLVSFCVEWNKNAKFSYLSTVVFDTIIRLKGVQSLLAIEGMNSLCVASNAYLQRHITRLTSLQQKAFILDIALLDVEGSHQWKRQADIKTHDILYKSV